MANYFGGVKFSTFIATRDDGGTVPIGGGGRFILMRGIESFTGVEIGEEMFKLL